MNITIDNYKEFHNILKSLGFIYNDFPDLGWCDYHMMLQDNGKTRFRLGISIHDGDNPYEERRIQLTVRKYNTIGELKHCGTFEQIEGSISVDTIMELIKKYS